MGHLKLQTEDSCYKALLFSELYAKITVNFYAGFPFSGLFEVLL